MYLNISVKQHRILDIYLGMEWEGSLQSFTMNLLPICIIILEGHTCLSELSVINKPGVYGFTIYS